MRGFLDHNLGEMQPIYAQPGTGNLEMNGNHNNLETVISGVVFTNLHFALGLQNVTVELGYDGSEATKLVRMEFIQSKLLFQAMSNNHKITSLVCQSYSATDLRPDVDIHPAFRDVIQTSKGANNNKVQVELFFKATPTGLSFKLVMETSRIIIQPDWMKKTLAFLLEHPEPEYSDNIRQKVLDHILAANQEPHNPGSSGEVEIGKRLPLDITSNVHETRFILVDDLADPFSHGIILKSTALVTKDDQSACLSLQSLEVFSCEILNESETSLSILDPTSFDFTYHDIPGQPIKVDINLNAIQMRLSYRDYLLLMSIAKNVKNSISGENISLSSLTTNIGEKEHKVFWGAEPMCTISQDDIMPTMPKLVELPEGNGTLTAEAVTLVLIDDSGDRDIPLIEFEAKNIAAEADERRGMVRMQVLCCLYNQHLSLWEPLIEPFDFELHGERDKTGYQVDIQSKNRLNINVTENLLFFQRDIATRLSKLLHESESTFVRAKFRPYTIENRTGLEMYFGTNASEKNWKVLKPGCDADFNFVRQHEKVRKYQNKMDRIWFTCGGWHQIEPVTVNKVGTFFRHAVHPTKTEPIRIVIEVKLIASARKLVTVRSALQIISKISMPIEILCQNYNLDSIDSEDGTPIDGRVIGRLEPNSKLYVEIGETNSELRIRPCSGKTFYSNESIKWWTSQSSQCQILNCSGQMAANGVSYQCSKSFFTRVERLDFPTGNELLSEIEELERRAREVRNGPSRAKDLTSINLNTAMPGHNCYIYPAITIKNLLPLDLGYWLVGQNGMISSHKSEEIFYHPTEINLRLKLEGFQTSEDILLPRDRQMTTTGNFIYTFKFSLLLENFFV